MWLQAVATMQWTTASMSFTHMSRVWTRSRPRSPQHSGALATNQHAVVLSLSCSWHYCAAQLSARRGERVSARRHCMYRQYCSGTLTA